MNSETAQKLWKIYCDELILDNGDKTSEDVRQALATFLRKIVSDWEEFVDEVDTYGIVVVTSDNLLQIAHLLENLND
jgi:hypothetical protein